MLRFAVRGTGASTRELRFGVHVRNDNRERMPPLVRLKAVSGPGDDGKLCITIMFGCGYATFRSVTKPDSRHRTMHPRHHLDLPISRTAVLFVVS
jgi:hypothetical protein